MSRKQLQSLINSGHIQIPIQTIRAAKRTPRVVRPGLVLTIALVSLSIGIVLGQVWANAQNAQRQRTDAAYGITTQN